MDSVHIRPGGRAGPTAHGIIGCVSDAEPEPADAAVAPGRLPRGLRPFRTRRYRLLATALTLSLFGAGVWLIAVVFQIKGMGGGPGGVAVVATVNAVGLLLAVLFGGAVADRVPQRRILLTVEIVKGALVATVALLAAAGALEVWQLAVAGFVLGVADGFFMPAYSAMLPSILPAEQLLAANGFEGMLRPAVLQAGGPAVAAVLVAAFSPAAAFGLIAVTQLLAICCLAGLGRVVPRRAEAERRPLLADVHHGIRYLVRTPWLLASLLFASSLVLLVLGPVQVLLPFAVTTRTGVDAAGYALVLLGFGAGGAAAALTMGSLRLPRRYLTAMVLVWGAGCLPLVLVAVATELWIMVVAAVVVGIAFSIGSVIWGTLLQRRVPTAMLGRVSSLDSFVSLALMPVSTALAGVLGAAVGAAPVFLVAGLAPLAVAALALLLARMPRDELAHPLDVPSPG